MRTMGEILRSEVLPELLDAFLRQHPNEVAITMPRTLAYRVYEALMQCPSLPAVEEFEELLTVAIQKGMS